MYCQSAFCLLLNSVCYIDATVTTLCSQKSKPKFILTITLEVVKLTISIKLGV